MCIDSEKHQAVKDQAVKWKEEIATNCTEHEADTLCWLCKVYSNFFFFNFYFFSNPLCTCEIGKAETVFSQAYVNLGFQMWPRFSWADIMR